MSNKKIHTDFYDNGEKKSEGHYKDGKKHGKWKSWLDDK